MEVRGWKSTKTQSTSTLRKPTTILARQIEQIGGCSTSIHSSFNNKLE